MSTRLHVTIVTALLLASAVPRAAGPRAILIEARDLAYDANYRNDQAGLRSAIASLKTVVVAPEEGPYANYYLSWSYWALSGSQVQENNPSSALESAKLAVEHARVGLAARNTDPEFHTALANALIVVAILDRPQFDALLTEVQTLRRRALELGPDNPRTVLMDAGMIFFTPHTIADRRDEGLARWEEALRLFDAEANAKAVDPIAPRWGHALAYGSLATQCLRMTPPRKERARSAAEAALRMRPDFWYVREQVMPRLRE